MAYPYAHGRQVKSLFQFYGETENDITNAFVWVLANCPIFARNFVNHIFGTNVDISDEYTVSTQDYDSTAGITDVEITDNKNLYIIVEAKRGWVLPKSEQLELYSHRKIFCESSAAHKAIVTMSECSQEFAALHLSPKINETQVCHISWKELFLISKESIATSAHKQKWLLSEFKQFLGGLTTMQKQESNIVYVVALSDDKPEGWDISWLDIVKVHGLYFHPVGKSWPTEPPNYIGFRYGGKLQSIHHIEEYKIFTNPHLEIAEIPNQTLDPHFLYILGKAIVPQKEVRTDGKRIPYAARVLAMLDTLLTSDTIAEACDITKKRLNF